MTILSETHVTPANSNLKGDSADDARAGRQIEADLTYLVDTGARPVTYMPPYGGGEIRRSGTYRPYRVTIRDARPFAAELDLDRQGFALTHHVSTVTNFFDADEVRRVYYPEMARLVAAETGASRVEVFDHSVRVEGAADREADGTRAPVRMVHNDYTAKSGPQRVRDLFAPDEAGALLAKRLAIINVWRPIAGPVESAPLALADSRSVGPRDWVPLDLVYPDRVGEIYNATYSPNHRWSYFPRMERHEAVLIKGYDSLADGRARFTLHTAFDDPTTPADSAPRQSIEVRTLAVLDD